MIKLLIIDDEEEVRNGISNSIDWAENGIEVCGTAANGKEAFEIIERISPDIMLVDIRMPIMNGLQLIEKIKTGGNAVRSIVLSGYDDFSYAQTALKLGASDYLLKPCKSEEILLTVLKVKSAIEKENTRDEMVNQMRTQFNQSIPLLKEKFLSKLLTSDKKFKENIERDFKLYRINLEFKNYSVIVFRIDDFYNFQLEHSNEDVDLMKFAIKNIAAEILSDKYNCEIFENNDDIIAVINCEADISESLISIKQNIKNLMGFTVSIGVGSNHNNLVNLHLSYNEALISIDEKFLIGSDTVIKYCDLHYQDTSDLFYPSTEENQIMNLLRTGNSNNFENAVDDFFNALENNHAKKDYIERSSIALALSVYHFCIQRNCDTNEIFGKGFFFFDQLQKLDSIAKLKEKIKEIINKTHDKVNSKKNSNRIIEAAIRFIEENYNKDLNLESVARMVYITPSYLSLLFKQIAGINFVDFLHRTRIEKACSLLKDVRLKTYEVASNVGYADEKYFSQIFKKHIGITPSQYRDFSSSKPL